MNKVSTNEFFHLDCTGSDYKEQEIDHLTQTLQTFASVKSLIFNLNDQEFKAESISSMLKSMTDCLEILNLKLCKLSNDITDEECKQICEPIFRFKNLKTLCLDFSF